MIYASKGYSLPPSYTFPYLPKCCNICVHSALSRVKCSLGFTSTPSFPTPELFIHLLFQILCYLITPGLGTNLTPIFCCHLEAGKALEVLDALGALCFSGRLDPLDSQRMMLHRRYVEIHSSHIKKLKSSVRVSFNICTWERRVWEWLFHVLIPGRTGRYSIRSVGFRKSVTTSFLSTENVAIKQTIFTVLWWLCTKFIKCCELEILALSGQELGGARHGLLSWKMEILPE